MPPRWREAHNRIVVAGRCRCCLLFPSSVPLCCRSFVSHCVALSLCCALVSFKRMGVMPRRWMERCSKRKNCSDRSLRTAFHDRSKAGIAILCVSVILRVFPFYSNHRTQSLWPLLTVQLAREASFFPSSACFTRASVRFATTSTIPSRRVLFDPNNFTLPSFLTLSLNVALDRFSSCRQRLVSRRLLLASRPLSDPRVVVVLLLLKSKYDHQCTVYLQSVDRSTSRFSRDKSTLKVLPAVTYINNNGSNRFKSTSRTYIDKLVTPQTVFPAVT